MHSRHQGPCHVVVTLVPHYATVAWPLYRSERHRWWYHRKLVHSRNRTHSGAHQDFRRRSVREYDLRLQVEVGRPPPPPAASDAKRLTTSDALLITISAAH